MVVLSHQVEHDITPFQRIVWVDEWIIIGGCLEHTHEDSGILRCQVLWLAVEVGLAGRLDAEGVGAEVHGIGILRQNLVLCEEELELIGCDPLLALHDEHL